MAENLKVVIGGVEYEIQGEDLASESTLKDILAAIERCCKSGKSKDRPAPVKADDKAKSGKKGDGTRSESSATAESSSSSSATLNMFRLLRSGIRAMIPGFSMLGAIVGVITAAFSTTAGILTGISDSLKEVYASGIRLDLGLSKLTVQAAKAGMSFDQLTKLIVRNQLTLSRFGGGGSILDGTKQLTKMARELTFTTAKLSRLGLGTEEVAQLLVDYADIQNALNISNTTQDLNDFATQERLRLGTVKYLGEIDALARMTGKTREEMNNMIKETTANADLLAAMNLRGLSEKQRENFTALIASIGSLPGGGTVSNSLIEIMQQTTAIGDLGHALATVAPNFSRSLYELENSIRTTDMSAAVAMYHYTNALVENADQIINAFERVPIAARTQAQRDLLLAANNARARQKATQDEINAYRERGEAYAKLSDIEVLTAINKEQGDLNEARVRFNDAMTRIQGSFVTFMVKVFGNPKFIELFNRFTEGLEWLTDKIVGFLNTDTIDSAVRKSIEGITEFVMGIWSSVSSIFSPIKDMLVDGYKKLLDLTFDEISIYLAEKLPGGENGAQARARIEKERAEEKRIALEKSLIEKLPYEVTSLLARKQAELEEGKKREEYILRQVFRAPKLTTELADIGAQRPKLEVEIRDLIYNKPAPAPTLDPNDPKQMAPLNQFDRFLSALPVAPLAPGSITAPPVSDLTKKPEGGPLADEQNKDVFSTAPLALSSDALRENNRDAIQQGQLDLLSNMADTLYEIKTQLALAPAAK